MRWMTIGFALLSLIGTALGPAQAEAPPEGARVFFVDLKDGDMVSSPFVVRFGLEGMRIARAGINLPGTGHHHLLIDAELTDEDHGFAIPEDANHRHFGAGQTEVELTLPPGTYTLQIVFGDGDHVPFDPMLNSDRIRVTVQ